MRDEELLRQYLLGALPEAEAEALEGRLLAEEELFDLAEAIESEILEDYARDGPELSSAERARVARHLAASSSGRLRLAVIHGLTTLSASGRVLPFPRVRPRDRALAVAAMLLVTLGAVIGIRTTVKPPPVEIAQHTPTPTPTPTPPPDPVVPPPVPTPPPPPSVFTAVTMILSSVRGEEEIASVQVPAGADLVELPLQLPIGYETYSSYQVVLKLGGEEVSSFQDLHARRSLLLLEIDAERLRTGRYTLLVSGVNPDGTVHLIDFKEFEIAKS